MTDPEPQPSVAREPELSDAEIREWLDPLLELPERMDLHAAALANALLAAREQLAQARSDIMQMLAEKLPEGTTVHRMVTTYPKMHQRMLGDADSEIASLRKRAEAAERQVQQAIGTLELVTRKREAAEANCAALKADASRVLECFANGDPGSGLATIAAMAAALSPGDALLARLARYKAALRQIATNPEYDAVFVAQRALEAQP